jgi:hypothetical protein
VIKTREAFKINGAEGATPTIPTLICAGFGEHYLHFNLGK